MAPYKSGAVEGLALLMYFMTYCLGFLLLCPLSSELPEDCPTGPVPLLYKVQGLTGMLAASLPLRRLVAIC